jgi:hypothetical protein
VLNIFAVNPSDKDRAAGYRSHQPLGQ